MLAKKNRLNKDLIKGIIKSGKQFSSDNIFLKIGNIDDKNSIFAFVVLSGATKKAVARNKLKRRARDITRSLIPSAKKGLAIVLFFRKTAINKDFSELKEEISNLFKKAKIL